MQLDMAQFPIIWMRDHEDGEHEDEAATRDALIGLLDRGEKFVLVAGRLPTLADLTDASPAEKKMRAQLFKAHRARLTQLCAGMIMVGSAANLPQPIRKAMEAFTAMMGVAVYFTATITEAEAIAQDRLAAG